MEVRSCDSLALKVDQEKLIEAVQNFPIRLLSITKCQEEGCSLRDRVGGVQLLAIVCVIRLDLV